MRRIRDRTIAGFPWIAAACVLLVVALATEARAQGSDSPGDSLAFFTQKGKPRVTGTSYAGHIFDPQHGITTHSRAGSAMPAYRQAQRVSAPEVIPEAGPVYEEPIGTPSSGDVIYESGPVGNYDGSCGADCGGACGLGGECGDCGCGDCGDCGGCGLGWGMCGGCGEPECDECIPICLPRLRYLAFFAGVHGFTNPIDSALSANNRVSGNFGFQEGFNIGSRLRNTRIGYQVGYQSVQSRLSGDVINSQARVQHFLTAGFFRRPCVGLQLGAVGDFLWDDDLLLDNKKTLSQLRAEISFVGPRGGEVGFWTAIRGKDRLDFTGAPIGVIDQYQFFVRKQYPQGGECRFSAGWTRTSDAVIGGDVIIPVSDRFAFAGMFNYLIPRDREALGGIQESWNIGLNVVWYPRCKARSSYCNSARPLFNVADNGIMFLDRLDLIDDNDN